MKSMLLAQFVALAATILTLGWSLELLQGYLWFLPPMTYPLIGVFAVLIITCGLPTLWGHFDSTSSNKPPDRR